MRVAIQWARARAGILAIVAIGISWGSIMHSMGWAQLGHYAEVRALADGRKDIDPWHWETGDVAYIDGHYYSVKSPGTAALSTLPYLAIEGMGGLDLAADAAANAAGASSPRWIPDQEPPFAQYGYDAERAQVVQERIEDGTTLVWALTLLVAVIPSILLLLGAIQDRAIGESLARHDAQHGTELHATFFTSEKTGVFGKYYALEEEKVAQSDVETHAVVSTVVADSNKLALRSVAVLPLIMLGAYLALLLYFRRQGGYKPVALQTEARP